MIAVTIAPPAGSSSAARSLHVGEVERARASRQSRNIATRKPKSPMRFTMNAFLPASALALSLNQKPISR